MSQPSNDVSIPIKPSKYREYLATAATDLDHNGGRNLEVYCAEILPFVSGEIKAKSVANEVKTKDSGGKSAYQGSVNTSTTITAVYRDDNPNRLGPPTIRKSEQVILYNYGDTNHWYWKPTGRTENQRRLEQVRYGASGSLENKAEQNDDNMYYLEFNTIADEKNITISTSAANGEKHRYKFCINTTKSLVTLTDESENIFFIDSEAKQLGLCNQVHSHLLINDKDITIACKGNICLKTEEGSIMLDSGKDIVLRAKNNIAIENKGAFAWESSGSGTIKVQHLSIKDAGG